MSSMNNWTGNGRLVGDPVVRDAGSTKVCNFTIALNEKYKDKEETTFVDVVFWAGQAETIGQYCHKGDLLGITGSLRQERWEKDGEKRSKIVIRGNQFEFLSAPKGNSNSQQSESPAPSSIPDDDVPF